MLVAPMGTLNRVCMAMVKLSRIAVFETWMFYELRGSRSIYGALARVEREGHCWEGGQEKGEGAGGYGPCCRPWWP